MWDCFVRVKGLVYSKCCTSKPAFNSSLYKMKWQGILPLHFPPNNSLVPISFLHFGGRRQCGSIVFFSKKDIIRIVARFESGVLWSPADQLCYSISLTGTLFLYPNRFDSIRPFQVLCGRLKGQIQWRKENNKRNIKGRARSV